MDYRLLGRDEYSKLIGLGDMVEKILPDPNVSVVVVAEEHQQITGYWVIQDLAHVEPVWVHPDHRKTTIGARMWSCVRAVLDASNVPGAFCCAETPDVADYLLRLGFRELPHRLFVYEVS